MEQQVADVGIIQLACNYVNHDLDLFEEVKKFLISNNASSEQLGAYLADRFVVDSMDKPPILQKVLISAFFSRQILMFRDNVPQSIRLALSSVGSEMEWLEVAKLIVLPYMLSHSLPRYMY